MENLYLPIRHGTKMIANDPNVISRLFENGQVALQYADESGRPSTAYPANPNGSVQAIAGICDATGRILGMMAHPEAFMFFTHHPQWTRMKEKAQRLKQPLPEFGEGLSLFKNAIEYLRGTS